MLGAQKEENKEFLEMIGRLPEVSKRRGGKLPKPQGREASLEDG